MAKKNSTAQSATKTAKVAKVAKLDKAAKPAKAAKVSGQQAAKPAKAAKASGQQAARRGQYAGKSIRLTAEGKAANPRGNAGVLFDVIRNAKRVDDVLGVEYARDGGKYTGDTWTVKGVDLAYFERRGLIEIV